MVPGHQHQVRRLAWLQGANQTGETRRLGTVLCGHLQDLGRGWYAIVHTRHAMQPQDQAHLLQHITIIVDPGLV